MEITAIRLSFFPFGVSCDLEGVFLLVFFHFRSAAQKPFFFSLLDRSILSFFLKTAGCVKAPLSGIFGKT